MTGKTFDPVDPDQPLKTAVSYPRVSTKEQAEKDGEPDGYSLPAQRDANRRKAASLGAIIVKEFVERGESAKTSDRPKLQEMLAYIKERRVDYVIVHKVDRLARNRVDDVQIHMAIRAAGAELVSATENIDESPSGMLLHGIMSSIAEFYSRNLATEVLKGMTEKAKGGGTPGKARLGYMNIRVVNSEGAEVRTVAVDPERGHFITWAFQHFATGDWTLRTMTDELEVRGLTTRPSPKHPARPIKYNTLHQILTSPYYKGEVTYRGVRYPGRHEPLIDPVTWQTVQSVLASHAVGEKQREHPHYLKSTVFCGGCGFRQIVTHAKNRYGQVYPYFVCLGRHQKHTDCQRQAVLISRVEDLIEDEYRALQLSPELRERVEASLRDDLAENRAAAERATRELTTRQKRLLDERAKLLQAHYAGAVPLDLMKAEQDRIAAQLAEIDSRLEASRADLEVVEKNLRTALSYASNCYAAYLAANPQTRRLFNQAFFEKVYIEQDYVRADLAEPFKTLLGGGLVTAATGTEGEATTPEVTTYVEEGDQRPAADAVELMDLIRHAPAGDAFAQLSDVENEKPTPYGVGLKATILVPSAGFEPATPALGERCSIP